MSKARSKTTRVGRDAILAELQRIRKKSGGVLHPADVVDAARSPSSPLHSKFTWDDSVAAAEYRLWQAREMIRVCVTVMPNKNGEHIQVPAFHSLQSDRTAGGGYRHIVDVMSSADASAELLQQALIELDFIRKKYNSLAELAGVFAAVENVKKRRTGT